MTTTERRPSARRATIVDVARAAAVSRQTVSNVINQPEKVAPETLDRVTREILRLGYRPSRAARTLKQERAGAWGFEVNTLGAGRLGTILDGFVVEMTVHARLHDAYVVPFAAEDHGSPIPAYEDIVASRIADGFVLADTRHEDPRPAWLSERGIPFAAFGRIWDEPTSTNWVDVDGATGVAEAVRHLASEGYERIGYLGWPEGSPVGDDRRSGWAAATAALGLADDSLQARSVQELDQAALAAGPLLDAVGRGGAVVCASDALAVGVWRAMVERGLRPGLDIGLVGFDDTDLATAIGLSSVRQPLAEVAEHILAMLADGADREAGVLLAPSLVRRASSSRRGAEQHP